MTSIIELDANEHPIESVTIFKSKKAEVVRIFKVSLEVILCDLQRLNSRRMSYFYFLGRPE
jgi:hypothetical protein